MHTFRFANYSTLFLTALASISITNIVEDDPRPALEGRICAFADMDKDRSTDLIVQQGDELVILNQSELGEFTENKNRFDRIKLASTDPVFCSVGDFDGDAAPDILVIRTKIVGKNILGWGGVARYEIIVYYSRLPHFIPLPATGYNFTFVDHPAVVDLNGDGMSDIIGFTVDPNSSTNDALFCRIGNKDSSFAKCDDLFKNFNYTARAFPNFSPIFTDLDSDLGSEIIFGLIEEDKLRLSVWKMDNDDFYWAYQPHKSIPLPSSAVFDIKNYGGAVVGDFDADSGVDILIPICGDTTCRTIASCLVFTKNRWITVNMDLKGAEIVTDDTKVLFRAGDFSLDGYPDLVASVRLNGKVTPMIIENVEYPDNPDFNRKFELKTTPRMVMPAEMSKGEIQLSSYFDLKEDGNLDILVEYQLDSKTKIDFIKCDDKGDTTFLKVQIFTNICTNDCPNPPTIRGYDIGSGVTWHGACVSFSMTDSNVASGSRVSAQCQLPQTSHRVLHSPFVLFGLGRSPNFVEEVNLGSPRWPGDSDNQRHQLRGVVPNSRVVVIPPEKEDTHWQSRLYVTPSRLIILSLLVISSMCGILLLLIAFLHFRERQQDRKERQAQTHRFHFDAM